MFTVTVFISYSGDDREHRDACREYLEAYKGEDPRIEVFDDDEITLGKPISKSLAEAIDGADIYVILLSNNYLRDWKSKDHNWRREEWEHLRARLSNGGCLVPVLLRACPWEAVLDELAEMPIYPGTDTPISEDAQTAKGQWYRLASKVRRAAGAIAATHHHGPEAAAGLAGPNADPLKPVNFLRQAVSSGTITPVLGPGCYDAPENRERGQEHVQGKRDALLQALEKHVERSELARCQEYVRSVIEDNFPGLPASPRLGGGSVPRTEFGRQVLELQVLLVYASVRVVRLFGQSMDRSAHGISDAGRYHLPVHLSAADADSIAGLFHEARKLAQRIDDKWGREANDIGLGAHGIASYLKKLAARFHAGESELHLTELAWLGDLLWHLIRYDAPMYPTVEELGFQIAVWGAIGGPARRRPASAVAMSMEDEQHVAVIREWFGRYGSAEALDVAVPFYEKLAEALCIRAPRPANGAQAEAAGPRRSSDSGTGQFVPVAVSCNFDRELERALLRRGRSFHVTFPVRLAYAQRASMGPETGWVLRTIQIADDGMTHDSDQLLDASLRAGHLAVLRGNFIGPLIVKLHGSPLDELPKVSSLAVKMGPAALETARPSGLRHKLVFSDHQIIADAIGGGDVLPPGLRELLGEAGKRMVCFFGFPLRDPNSRLRVLHTLSTSPQALLQEYPEDELRSPLVTRLGVRYYAEQLDEVARVINSELPRHSVSPSGEGMRT
jgi:hypothetical protein